MTALALDPVEVRVLGCLIEKERATPQSYPLTLNSLRLACNQSTNRHPVTDYDDSLLDVTVTELKDRGLLRFVYSTSNRATKYRHVLDEVLRLTGDELAVLCGLMLRGPQTVGEIKGRSDRLHEFGNLSEVQEVLDELARRDPDPLVTRLERQPGQKDARWAHLLGTSDLEVSVGARADPYPVPSPANDPAGPSPFVEPRDDRVDGLIEEVRVLHAELMRLRADFEALLSDLDD